MRLWTRVMAIFDRTLELSAGMSGVIVIGMMLCISVDVVMRYFLNRPIMWTVEINEYALLWVAFLGAAWVLKRDRHVMVEVVVNQLKPRTQAMMGIITSVVGAIVCAIVAWYSGQATWSCWVRGVSYAMSVLHTPVAWVLVVIPVLSFLMFLQFLRRTSGYLEKWRALSHSREGT